jgi:hypothetical protein
MITKVAESSRIAKSESSDRPNHEPPERPRGTIDDRKMMVTIAWNSLRFHFVEALRKDRIFNAECYRDNILTAFLPLLPAPGAKQLV